MLAESAPWIFCQINTVMLTCTHPRSYCQGVLATEMKNKIPSLSSTMMLIWHQWLPCSSSFFPLRCWFLRMNSLAVTSSTSRTSMKFWGTSFKFWSHPWLEKLLKTIISFVGCTFTKKWIPSGFFFQIYYLELLLPEI